MKMRDLLLVLVTVLCVTQTATAIDSGPKLSGTAVVGYFGGLSYQLSGTISGFAVDFPLALRIGVGYTTREPGSAADARRIFINDATNGIPEKSGRMWDFRLDFVHPMSLLSLNRSFLFAGPRYSRFTGNFKYVGGNEDFDVTSKQWGLGAGIESHFAMGRHLDLVMSAGTDYYFNSTLGGHDTQYSPDGDDVNPRNDYTYDDADEAVAQPKFEIRLMAGVAYRF